jgi:hypothetical protein
MLTGYSKLISPEISLPGTFLQFLSGMHLDARWVAQKLELSGNWDTWATGNQRHQLQGVSDGSFKNHLGTAAFILVIEDDPQMCIQGRVVTPGNIEDHNTYRSELAGIYALTVVHWAVCTFYNVDFGQIEIACDGKSALLQAQFQEDFINTRYPHYDLILALETYHSGSGHGVMSRDTRTPMERNWTFGRV